MQISFSGRLGSGKSTVCAILKEKYGYEIYSTGTVQRKIAEEMGITTLELNKRSMVDHELDHVIDDTVTRISRERKGEKLIFDSRMAWHFADNTFKVYMYVDPTVAAKRVFAADRGNVEHYDSVEDAKEQLLARTLEENKRYKVIYGVDNLDFNNYDLIVDSTLATAEDIANAMMENVIEYEVNPFANTKLMLAPTSIIPTKSVAHDDSCNIIKVTFKNALPYCTAGHNLLAKALKDRDILTAVVLETEDCNIEHSKDIISEYEKVFGVTYESK